MRDLRDPRAARDPTVGGATLRRGETFSLATGGGVLSIPATTDAQVERAPEKIGTYRIIDRLGEGGMGTVYLAEQLAPVRRQVALKVLKSAVISKHAIARFEAERQAMALLSHPNVAQMFDAGTGPDGHPYFAMELVSGVAITDYCDRERLGLPERLTLFRAVCSGVQHAHQKGIIHRDLKPSNVLVAEIDGQAIPKIIDFGIAKAIDRPLVQETLVTGEALIGTLGYLSPEALGSAEAIDTRSDVYALGILLYELLVGVRPFDQDSSSLLEVIRRIVEDEALPPSRAWKAMDAPMRQRLAATRSLDAATAGRRLEGDLEWVVAKAVAKDRDTRYPSAAELSAEIGRYLRHEAVEAGPPGGLYRLRKLVRRHRGFVAAATLLLLSLVGGLVFRTAEARRANRQAEAARQVTRFLIDMFEVADPLREAGVDITARELLERGARRVREDLPGQPLIRAQLLDAIANVYGNLGLFEESGELAREALTLRRELLPKNHRDLATSLETVAAVALRQGRYSEAEELLSQVLAMREEADGLEHTGLARPLTLLGEALVIQDRADEALEHLRRALKIQESSFGPHHLKLADTLSGLGRHYQRVRRHDEAEVAHRRALDIRQAKLGADHALVADSLEGLGETLTMIDRYADAIAHFERALAIRESVYGDDHPAIVPTLYLVGQCYLDWGRYASAEDALLRAVKIGRASPDLDPRELARVISGLGLVAWRLEDRERCISLFRESIEIFETAVGADHSDTAWIHSNIANCQVELERLDEAEASYLTAQAIFTRVFGSDHSTTVVPLQNLGSVYIAQGKLAKAEEAYRTTLGIWERAFGPDHSYVAFACSGLGDVYSARQQWAEAERWHRRALVIREGMLDPGSQDMHVNLTSLAEALRGLERIEEAETLEARVPPQADAPES